MILCASCSEPILDSARFCPACGVATAVAQAPVTSPAPSADTAINQAAVAVPPHVEVSRAHLMPGLLLGGRYRLVALLGRGGMGEVYRAEDTRLGQTVALKFLPPALSGDHDMLERFFAEVRIGRQVSHPNVCRLHDLIEIDGHHVLSMEYVDGEDLSALLGRIGRLPPDKAIDIARDLCAGLAAAHEKGVIHRDLKPANIMIDGRGRARIADFGIAALADSMDRETTAGTPAYMAPELLDGAPATVQSDLYALGLVLHETCTGKRLLEGRSLDEIRERHKAMPTPLASDRSIEVPRVLERVIQHCLERDPQARPASALVVLATLPGGDPLSAALAAGETPSPAMVAAANRIGSLSATHAWSLLVLGLAGLLALLWTGNQATLLGRLDPPKPPQVLDERARVVLAELGHGDGAQRDRHGFFSGDLRVMRNMGRHATSLATWDVLSQQRPGPLLFVHRQSNSPMLTTRTVMRPFGASESGRVNANDPPATQRGMVDVLLDPQGNFLGLRAMLAATDVPDPGPMDWSALLDLAGLDPARLTPAAVSNMVPVNSDEQKAWLGSYANQPDRPLRIEAAGLRGRAVWFAIYSDWNAERHEFTAPDLTSRDMTRAQILAVTTIMLVSTVMWVAIGLLVRRNLRLGRADRQGAMRLTLFLAACALLAQILRADHVSPPFEEISLIVNLVAQVSVYAVVNWLVYIALEPIARRRWPQLLVGWNRLLLGRIGDPLVGRDLVLGVLCGLAMVMVVHLSVLAPLWLGTTGEMPHATVISSLSSIRHLGYFALWSTNAAVVIGFGALLGYLINRSVLRHAAPAVLVLFVCLYFGFAALTGLSQVWSWAGAVFAGLFLLTLLRVGMLSAVIGVYVFLLMDATPLTLNLGTWYADRTLLPILLMASILGYGAWRALDGKSPFGDWLSAREGSD